ncbi:MAG: ABC transporter permease [Comamonadaceae bacterium]|nr:MAG: ABC transporter permease [Comamonadaceae bacterium]
MARFIRFARDFARRWPALLGLVLLLGVVCAALLAPLVYPEDPLEMVGQPLTWPGQDSATPLGTDTLGRDVASGLAHGARVSLAVGVSATLAALLVGIGVGAAAGYSGGRIDDLLMRLTEVFQTIPSFVLLIVIVVVLQPSLGTVTFAIAAVSWPGLARLVRAEVMALRKREFVQSCVTVGMGHLRIVLTQILPNCLAPVIVTASIMMASAILMETGLSFLGLGDPNVVSWGSMIGNGRNSLRTAWYLCAIPGVAIILTVLSINLVAEGLNDVLNPRLQR